jgi:hypothetical protein
VYEIKPARIRMSASKPRTIHPDFLRRGRGRGRLGEGAGEITKLLGKGAGERTAGRATGDAGSAISTGEPFNPF